MFPTLKKMRNGLHQQKSKLTHWLQKSVEINIIFMKSFATKWLRPFFYFHDNEQEFQKKSVIKVVFSFLSIDDAHQKIAW